jgi:hypothetical protein
MDSEVVCPLCDRTFCPSPDVELLPEIRRPRPLMLTELWVIGLTLLAVAVVAGMLALTFWLSPEQGALILFLGIPAALAMFMACLGIYVLIAWFSFLYRLSRTNLPSRGACPVGRNLPDRGRPIRP